jgi:hypothetical protein
VPLKSRRAAEAEHIQHKRDRSQNFPTVDDEDMSLKKNKGEPGNAVKIGYAQPKTANRMKQTCS